jgi:hypothetical protein
MKHAGLPGYIKRNTGMKKDTGRTVLFVVAMVVIVIYFVFFK